MMPTGATSDGSPPVQPGVHGAVNSDVHNGVDDGMDTGVYRDVYTRSCERVLPEVTRAYGRVLTGWMTGFPELEFGPGTPAQQHARISEYFRRALTDRIESEADRHIGACLRAGTWPLTAPAASGSGSAARANARTRALEEARTRFVQSQYRMNLKFFFHFVDLERDRQNALTEACLRGATSPPTPPPHDPEPGPC